MWYAANLADAYKLSSSYGFQYQHFSLDFAKLVNNRDLYLRKLNQLYEKRLAKDKVMYLQGHGAFINSHTLQINNKNFSADHIVIATGCAPKKPQINGIEYAINSDGFFALKKLPKKVAIIGSGYIGSELATILNQLGSDVTFLFRYDIPLRNFDEFISNALKESMEKQGIKLFSNHIAFEIKKIEENQFVIFCEDNKIIADVDCIIYAVGRTPRTADLNLETISVKTDAEGFVITDKWEATNVPHIYAIGDVTGKSLLTPVAIRAGRTLATRIFGGEKNIFFDYENIPTVVFTHPPIGSIGLSEADAVKKYGKDKITIYENQFDSLFYGVSDQKILSKMKLITLKETGKIIGCHLIGMESDEILQGFAVAIKMGATKQDLENTLAVHPTNAEELLSN